MLSKRILNSKRCEYLVITITISLIIYFSTTLTYANATNTFVLNTDVPPVYFNSVFLQDNPVANKPFDINATITVSGSEDQHTILYISIPRELNSLSPPVIDLGNLSQSDGKKSVRWTLMSLSRGSFPINITAYYSDKSTISADQNKYGSISFPLYVSVGYQIEGTPSFQIRGLKVTPLLAFPGTIGAKVEADILNNGYVIATNVSTKLKSPWGLYPTWTESDSFYIGRILPNQNVTASFFLNIDNNITSNVLPLSINLFHDNGNITLPTALSVASKARFELIDVVNSNQLYPGAINVPLRMTFKNIGNAVAETITTKLLAGNTIPGVKSNLQTTIGNTEDIGNVLPGETFTTTFIVNVGDSEVGERTGSVELKWTQPGLTDTTTGFINTIPISYTIEPGPNYLLYYNGISWVYVAIFIIFVLMIILFLIVRHRRNRKMELHSKYLSDTQSK